ncbi:amidohydrolase family protein [Streptosporangium sp. NPDC051022]|uniref:amidohydrolase family protein n=1 Tax=Streptosporangium sp. NPDC051022 TaxID=3155752 RepID=UPI0034489F72
MARDDISLIVRDAWLVPLDERRTPPFHGHLVVGADGRILRLAPGEPSGTGARILDARGRTLLPGFVSAHSHLWQSPFRGIGDGLRTWEWMGRLHRRYGPAFDDDDLYHLTRHGALDLLRAGVTTVYNHTHDFGRGAGGQWEAAFTVPQRTVYGFSPPMWAGAAERAGGIAAFAETAADRADDPRLLGLSVNTTGTMDVADMRAEADLIRSLGFCMQAHYLEDPTQAEQDLAAFDDLVAAGRVASDVTFAHFVHATPEIVAECARRGAGMVWNPLSNGRLGAGLPDIAGYREAGLWLGMGLDGQASADLADPFQNMRAGLYALRMHHRDPAVLSCEDMLRLHTVDSAALLGVAAHVGSLAPGRFADFLLVDLSRYGPVEDRYAHLVLAASATDITAVHVGGADTGDAYTGDTGDTGDAEDMAARVARIRARAKEGEARAKENAC